MADQDEFDEAMTTMAVINMSYIGFFGIHGLFFYFSLFHADLHLPDIIILSARSASLLGVWYFTWFQPVKKRYITSLLIINAFLFLTGVATVANIRTGMRKELYKVFFIEAALSSVIHPLLLVYFVTTWKEADLIKPGFSLRMGKVVKDPVPDVDAVRKSKTLKQRRFVRLND